MSIYYINILSICLSVMPKRTFDLKEKVYFLYYYQRQTAENVSEKSSNQWVLIQFVRHSVAYVLKVYNLGLWDIIRDRWLFFCAENPLTLVQLLFNILGPLVCQTGYKRHSYIIFFYHISSFSLYSVYFVYNFKQLYQFWPYPSLLII